MHETLEQDLAAIARIDVVPTILEVICRTTGLGFSAVARVTDDRWIACAVRDDIAFGLEPGGELPVETTICSEIRDSGQRVVIDHVAEDEAFRDHPTPALYGFQSYISVPIRRRDGSLFGTLCAIDPRPARLNTAATIGMFELFANLIALHLDAGEQLQQTEAALLDAHQRAELQDQFIAVLGHDLRNPLSAMQTGARTLMAMELGHRATHVAQVIDRSATRMSGLIHHVLDFARSRLGGGLVVVRELDGEVGTILEQVVAEMRTAQPERAIVCDIRVDDAVRVDRARIAQLLSNLLSNALTHGDPASPVTVEARGSAGAFELAVVNRGPAIHPDTLPRLFQPFARAADRTDRDGLGLGLYIAAEIARAHDARLEVSSTSEETRFSFHMDRRDD